MRTLLLVSHRGERCGVHQFGRNLHWMQRSTNALAIEYRECASADELTHALAEVRPGAVLFNFHPLTLPWLTPEVREKTGCPTFAVTHEIHQEFVDNLPADGLDFHVCLDPTIVATNPRAIVVPRFIPNPIVPAPVRKPLTIGSLGFATPGKGSERLCRLVNDQFDRAIIRINIPPHEDLG